MNYNENSLITILSYNENSLITILSYNENSIITLCAYVTNSIQVDKPLFMTQLSPIWEFEGANAVLIFDTE